MWESISSGAVGFSIRDGRQIGKRGGRKVKASYQSQCLGSPVLVLSLFFFGK